MGNTMRAWDADVAARTNVAASALTNRDVAEKFQAAVVEFSAADLARAARRTKAAAKGWKDGSRAPDSASMLTMARSLSTVQMFVAQEAGIGDRAAQANSMDAWMRGLYAIAAGVGPDAAKARWAIGRLNTPDAEPDQGNAPTVTEWRGENVVRDLFERRRARDA